MKKQVKEHLLSRVEGTGVGKQGLHYTPPPAALWAFYDTYRLIYPLFNILSGLNV